MPFCKLVFHAQKPIPPGYPATPNTVGEHIRKRRLDLGIQQKDLAEHLGIPPKTVSNWETNKQPPTYLFIPRIVAFLGYIPFTSLGATNESGNVLTARVLLGLTQREAARRLGVCKDTLSSWEHGRSVPTQQHTKVLETFINSAYRAGMTEGQSEPQPGVCSSSRYPAVAESRV